MRGQFYVAMTKNESNKKKTEKNNDQTIQTVFYSKQQNFIYVFAIFSVAIFGNFVM